MRPRHVLVPLLVVGLVFWLFLWRSDEDAPVVDLDADVAACARNLRQIYAALLIQQAREEHRPQDSGVALLGALIASGVAEDTPAIRALFTCPGRGAAPVPASVDYRDLAALDSSASAYALRDCAAFPLERFPSGGSALEPIAACDNERGMNHEGCMNVLWSDGSVTTLTLADEIENGRLPPGTQTIPVGLDSPLPELRKLELD